MIRKRVLALSVCFLYLFSVLTISAYADYVNTPLTFWEKQLHRYTKAVDSFGSFFGFDGLGQGIIGHRSGKICEFSDDEFHHADSLAGCETGTDKNGTFALATCKYCNQQFRVYSSDLEQDYSDYVKEMQWTSIDDEGAVIWYPTFEELPKGIGFRYFDETTTISDCDDSFILTASSPSYDNKSNTYEQCPIKVEAIGGDHYVNFKFVCTSGTHEGQVYPSLDRDYSYNRFNAPISGFYTLIDSAVYSDGQIFYPRTDIGFRDADSQLPIFMDVGRYNPSSLHFSAGSYSCTFFFPVYRIVLDSGAIDIKNDTTYNVNTRAGSITGDYGVLGDNNTITKSDTTYIVSEDDNSVYNPVTNTTTTYDNWTYDYADRSYHFTTQEGDTTTVTYGDENVTIKEGDTSYTVYYIYQTGNGDDTGSGGSGSGTVTPADPETEQALAKLAGMLKAMLSAIPDMVRGVTEFLSQAMPWVPDEIMWLIEFGCLFAIVFAIIKAVRR